MGAEEAFSHRHFEVQQRNKLLDPSLKYVVDLCQTWCLDLCTQIALNIVHGVASIKCAPIFHRRSQDLFICLEPQAKNPHRTPFLSRCAFRQALSLPFGGFTYSPCGPLAIPGGGGGGSVQFCFCESSYLSMGIRKCSGSRPQLEMEGQSRIRHHTLRRKKPIGKRRNLAEQMAWGWWNSDQGMP
jgi:hypothetical protein